MNLAQIDAGAVEGLVPDLRKGAAREVDADDDGAVEEDVGGEQDLAARGEVCASLGGREEPEPFDEDRRFHEEDAAEPKLYSD